MNRPDYKLKGKFLENSKKGGYQNVAREWSIVDILFNNAGTSSVILVEDMEKSE